MAVLSTASAESGKQGGAHMLLFVTTPVSLCGDTLVTYGCYFRGITITEHCPYCPHGVPCEDDSLSLSPGV